jgi:hypothetical protein
LLLATLAPVRFLLLIGIIGERAVAYFLNRQQNLAKPDALFVPAHQRALRRVIYAYLPDPGQTGDVLFVEPYAGGAGDAFQDQAGLASSVVGGMHELALNFGYVIDFGLAQKIGHQVLPAGRCLGPDAVKIFMPGGDDRLGHCLAAIAAHGAVGAIDASRDIEPCRNRQTAMKTGAGGVHCGPVAGFVGNFVIHGFSDC